jgi:hypothetical protein
VTFHLVVFAWILFRSQDLTLFGDFMKQLTVSGDATLLTVPVALAIVAVIGAQLLPERPVERLQLRIERMRPIVLAAALAVTILIVGATVPGQGVPPFIYFQF